MVVLAALSSKPFPSSDHGPGSSSHFMASSGIKALLTDSGADIPNEFPVDADSNNLAVPNPTKQRKIVLPESPSRPPNRTSLFVDPHRMPFSSEDVDSSTEHSECSNERATSSGSSSTFVSKKGREEEGSFIFSHQRRLAQRIIRQNGQNKHFMISDEMLSDSSLSTDYNMKYSQVEAYGLELESVEDVSSDEEEEEIESSLSPEPSLSGRSSSEGEADVEDSDQSDSSHTTRIVLDTDDEDEVFHRSRSSPIFEARIPKQEIYELSVNKLQNMSTERGSEMCLRKSVLIFNTMRNIQRELSFSTSPESSPNSSLRELERAEEETVDVEVDNSHLEAHINSLISDDVLEEEVPNQPRVGHSLRAANISGSGSPYLSVADSAGIPADNLLSNNPMEEDSDQPSGRSTAQDEATKNQQETAAIMLATAAGQGSGEWPSEHVYNCTQPDMGMMLCQQRAPSGAWIWSVAQSETERDAGRDTGYVLLDSAVMTPPVEPALVEAMDTSEHQPSRPESPLPILGSFQNLVNSHQNQGVGSSSIFSSTWSECTRSWEILNNNNHQGVSGGQSMPGSPPANQQTTLLGESEFSSLFSMQTMSVNDGIRLDSGMEVTRIGGEGAQA